MKLSMATKFIFVGLCIFGMAAIPAHAKKSRHYDWGHNYYADEYNYKGYKKSSRFYAKARVIDVHPVFYVKRKKNKHRYCWVEPVHHFNLSRDRTLNTVAGAAIGGVIGNQFGSGSGNTFATIAGAAIGSVIANQEVHEPFHNRKGNRYNRRGFQEVCSYNDNHRKGHKRKIKGYNVLYRYNGVVYETFMKHRPGKFIELVINIDPRR